MITRTLIPLAFFALLLPACGPKKPAGPAVTAYPAVPGLVTSDLYTVSAGGADIWVEKLRSDMDIASLPEWFTTESYTQVQQEVHIASFACARAAEVRISVPGTFNSASLRPSSRAIALSAEGNELRFTLKGPDKLVLEIDDLPPLFIFADAPEEDIPPASDPDVKYFGPGQHRPGLITLADDESVYIAPGAIVYGGIRADSAANIRVYGRGILDGNFEHQRMVLVENSRNVTFEGVMIRNGRSWTNTLINCRGLRYEGVKVISFGPGGDGINPLGSQDVVITGCFLRCTDDCIAIKSPGYDHVVKNVLVEKNTMIGYAFSDGITIGFETNGPEVSGVQVRNCDVLLARGGSRVDGHSGFSIICDGPALIHDILFEDIRVDVVEHKLFELHITDGTKYGEDAPGQIRNVRLRNIAWGHEAPIVLRGFGEQNKVEGVVFENCTVGGVPLGEKQHLIQAGPYAEGIQVVAGTGQN
jgi:hypothetical protein